MSIRVDGASKPLVLSVVLCSFLFGHPVDQAAAAPDTAAAPDLTGAVYAKDAQPIGNASIFIYTAGPRVGSGSI